MSSIWGKLRIVTTPPAKAGGVVTTENQSMAAGARGIVVARGRNGLQVQFDDTMIYAPYRQVKIVE